MPRNQVRVFVSSTFRDMQAERDHLVTVVFPELRERVETLGHDFYDVDLRWGVPETGPDGERANSWTYCRQWIERVRPFFVGLLGQRYGWVPPASTLADPSERAAFAGLSITEMEIRYAVLSRVLQRRSFFYFRKATVPADAMPEHASVFVDDWALERLAALKREVEESARPVRFYDARWTGDGFANLEQFGRLVLDDLWSGVLRDPRYVPSQAWSVAFGRDGQRERIYQDDARPLSPGQAARIVAQVRPAQPNPLDAEADQMAAFAASRLRWFRGVQPELDTLHRFVDEAASDLRSRLCVVSGPPGQGKSSLIANFAAALEGSDRLVLAHFVGATDRSSDVLSLLVRLVGELERHSVAPRADDAKQDVQGLKRRFDEHLWDYAGDRQLVLLIDGLNQLTDGHDLDWLPRRLGRAVRLVVSCADPPATPADTPEASLMAALGTRSPEPVRVRLAALGAADVRSIVVDYLLEYCKELDAEPIEAICAMPQASNPLYLLVMLDQLRTLGGDDMNVQVPQLVGLMRETRPDTVSLFSWMLDRLEVFGPETVRLWCGYLAVGRAGMASRELAELVERRLGPEAGRAALLVERGLRRYLQRRGPQLDFFHSQLREAVRGRYVPPDARALHADLARYFEGRWRRGDAHAISELAFHQTSGQRWPQLRARLTDLAFIEAKCATGQTHELVADFDAGLAAPGVPAAHRRAIEPFARFVRGQSHLLARRPELTLQQAANQPDLTGPERAARRWTRQGRPGRPWLRWVNKPQSADRCVMTYEGHRQEVDSCAVSADGRWLVSASEDKTLKVWDAARGLSVRTFEGHADAVQSCAVSPSGAHVVSADAGGHLKIWELATGNELVSMGEDGEPLATCAWSPDGQLVAVASYDRSVTIWRSADGERRGGPLRHDAKVLACSFSPDGGRLVSGGSDGRLRVWEVATGREVGGPPFGHALAVWSCSFTPDGGSIVSSSEDGTVRRWDAASRKQVALFAGHRGEVWCCAVSPDGRQLVSGGADGAVRVWDLASGDEQAVLLGHQRPVWGCAFVPGQPRVVSASWDASLKLWDSSGGVASSAGLRHPAPQPAASSIDGAPRVEVPQRGPMISCEVSRDGSTFLSGAGDGSVTLWDAETGGEVTTLHQHANYVSACALTPDRRWVISGDLDGDLRMFDLQADRPGPHLPSHGDQVSGCVVAPGGRLLATCSHDGSLKLWKLGPRGPSPSTTVVDGPEAVNFCVFAPRGQLIWAAADGGLRVWDLATQRELAPIGFHPNVVYCALTADGGRLASCSTDGSLRVWDVASREPIATVEAHAGPVQSCAFSPDGQRLVSASWDRTLKVWAVEDLTLLTTLHGHTGELQDVRFTGDGRRILSAAMDGTLRLWDAATGFELAKLVAPSDVALACTFSRDGLRLASVSHDQTVRLWDTLGMRRGAFEGHNGRIEACAFSPDGLRLVSASGDRTLKMWEVATGTVLATLTGHRGPVQCCAWSPDGGRIVSGARDATCRVWDSQTGALLAELAHPGWVRQVAFSADGARLLTCSPAALKVWDSARLTELASVAPASGLISACGLSHDGTRAAWGCTQGRVTIRELASGHDLAGEGHTGAVMGCAFEPGDAWLVTGSVDHGLRLWDARHGGQLAELSGHDGWVQTCAVSPDGALIASGATDGFLRLWGARTGDDRGQFWAGSPINTVCWAPVDGLLAGGDDAGRVHLLAPQPGHS